MNLFPAAQGRALPHGLTWINEPEDWEFTAAGLEVFASPQADFFCDPAGQFHNKSGNFLYQEVTDDFSLSAFVTADMQDAADSGCLMVMDDDRHWAKVCYEYCYEKPTVVSVVTNETSDDCNSPVVPPDGVHLRVTRLGGTFAFHYSLDGQYWVMVRYFALDLPPTIKAGLVAQSPVGEGCRVNFGRINLDPPAIDRQGIRSGR